MGVRLRPFQQEMLRLFNCKQEQNGGNPYPRRKKQKELPEARGCLCSDNGNKWKEICPILFVINVKVSHFS
jgi:hypothetical protein